MNHLGITLPSRFNDHIKRPIIVNNVFSSEECDRIIDNYGHFEQSTVYSGQSSGYNPDLRNSFSKFIETNQESDWIFSRLSDVCMDVNQNSFNFLLDSIQETQVLKYEKGGFFKLHTDLGTDFASTRKMTLVCLLSKSDSYEGGDLEFLFEGSLSREQGTIILFPSYLPHTVKMVKSGTRFTLVSWAHGPHFR